MSCSIHYTCPKYQQCRRHGPGRARGRGHAVGDQAEEGGEEATEIGERDEAVSYTHLTLPTILRV